MTAPSAPIRAAEDPAALAAERARVHECFPEAFAPVTDLAGLPRVLLVGDSISIGYTAPARELLGGVANVHRIPDNGGPTSRGLHLLDSWLDGGSWNVVHFNFGLHDVTLADAEQPRTTREDYIDNLRKLTTRLLATGARLVFATTTPVPEMLTHGPRRRDADVHTYNGAARQLMAGLGVSVVDLEAFARNRLTAIQNPGDVHFTPVGYRRLATPVAAAIRARLDP